MLSSLNHLMINHATSPRDSSVLPSSIWDVILGEDWSYEHSDTETSLQLQVQVVNCIPSLTHSVTDWVVSESLVANHNLNYSKKNLPVETWHYISSFCLAYLTVNIYFLSMTSRDVNFKNVTSLLLISLNLLLLDWRHVLRVQRHLSTLGIPLNFAWEWVAIYIANDDIKNKLRPS